MATSILKHIPLKGSLLVSLLIILKWLSFVSMSSAQTVAVQNGLQRGHGWMFLNGDACYLVLPRHLAEPLGRMRIRTAAPVAEGTAFGRTPFWPGIDLAVGLVSDNLIPRCTETLDALNLPGPMRDNRTGQLERLTGAGEIERLPLAIGERTYLTFTGTVAEDESVSQGTSGAFAFASGRPMGMAITTIDGRSATFIRAGEIRLHLARWIEEHGRPINVSAAPSFDNANDRRDLPIAFASSSVAATEPDFAGENLTTEGGMFAADPREGLTLLFRLGDNGDAVPLSQVIIRSPIGAGYAIPKDVLLEVSARDDASSMRRFTIAQMDPEGHLETPQRGATNARWLRIRVLSAWSDGPVAFSRVVVR